MANSISKRAKPLNVGRIVVWSLFAVVMIVAPMVFRSSHRTYMYAASGKISRMKMLWSAASPGWPFISSCMARVRPQPGQSSPVISLNVHCG